MYAKRTKSIKFCRFQNRNDGFSGVSLNHPSIMLHSLPKIIGAKKKATLLLLCSPFCALRIQQLSWETATLQAKIMKSKKVQEKRGKKELDFKTMILANAVELQKKIYLYYNNPLVSSRNSSRRVSRLKSVGCISKFICDWMGKLLGLAGHNEPQVLLRNSHQIRANDLIWQE